jgi:hypothetical protein
LHLLVTNEFSLRVDIDAQAPSDIEWSIATCFQDWLTARGGDGSIEIKQTIERIEHLLVTN